MTIRARIAAAAQPEGGSPSRAAVWAGLGIVYVVWGSTYLAIRVAVETMPPFLMAGIRHLVAGAVLYAWTARRGPGGSPRPTAAQWRATAIVGLALLLGGNGGVAWAEQHVSSSIAALLVATVPLWMALIAWIAFRERLRAAAIAGLVLGFGGVALLVDPSGGSGTLIGSLVVVGAALSWAAGSIYARGATLPRSPLRATAMESLAGGVGALVVGIAAGEVGRFDLSEVSLASALALAYLVVFGSLLALSTYVWLIGNVRTSLVATYAYVNPVVAVILGWLILAEPVGGMTLVAGAVIVAAVALIVTSKPRRPPAAEPA